VTTNATATNGGLFIVKGLRIENFIVGGTNIAAATTVDNIRAVYWLKDAATITNTVAGGCAREDKTTFSSQYVYVVNGAATSLIVYKYNIRAALSSLAGGAQVLTGADLVITGSMAVTGNISQNNNGRIATLNHGPGSGVSSLYMVTTTRVYRIPVSNITNGSVSYVADAMVENPPGSTTTFSLGAALGQVEYASNIDRLIVSNNANKCYVTQYRTDSGQMDHVFLLTNNQQDQASISSLAVPYPHIQTGVNPTIWSEGGHCFFCAPSVAAATNIIWIFPLGAHYTYAFTTGQYAITPAFNFGSIPSKFYKYITNHLDYLGGDEIGKSVERFKVYYRTSGISDNSGSWTLLADDGDLTGVSASSQIQFAFTFKVLGDTCIPSRIVSAILSYETSDSIPSELQWNLNDSNTSTATWGFSQVLLFSSLTRLTINIRRSDNNLLVLTQNTDSTVNGTFQYWNGAAWLNGLGPNISGTRRRFVATGSLPGSIDLYATLTAE